jgi:uncharacterized protein
MSQVTARLLSRILDGYRLPARGIHGLTHWARVFENGRKLAQVVEADTELIELFAVFHDARRVNDAVDHDHGRRGAQLARELRGDYFELDDDRFALLEYACAEHTSGLTEADLRVQVCWDADRLDLLRVGIRPQSRLLCTDAARSLEVIEWANERAVHRFVPESVGEEWGIDLGSKM